MSEVKIEGLSELDRQLKKLTGAVEGKIVRAGLNAANRVIRDAAKNLAPVDDGDLKKSIRVSSRVDKRQGKITSKVVAGNKQVYYAHFIEYGTANYYTGSGDSKRSEYKIQPEKRGALGFGSVIVNSVSHPGVRPRPFMRPAFDQNVAKALEEFGKTIRKRIEKEFSKKVTK